MNPEEKKAMASLVGTPVIYCGAQYEVVGVDEQQEMLALYNEKLDIRISCDFGSPHLKPAKIEESVTDAIKKKICKEKQMSDATKKNDKRLGNTNLLESINCGRDLENVQKIYRKELKKYHNKED